MRKTNKSPVKQAKREPWIWLAFQYGFAIVSTVTITAILVVMLSTVALYGIGQLASFAQWAHDDFERSETYDAKSKPKETGI